MKQTFMMVLVLFYSLMILKSSWVEYHSVGEKQKDGDVLRMCLSVASRCSCSSSQQKIEIHVGMGRKASDVWSELS